MTEPTRMLVAAVCVIGVMVATAYLVSLTGPRASVAGPGPTAATGTGVIRSMVARLNAEAAGVTMTVGFVLVDTGASCGMEIRRGVALFHGDLPLRPDVTIQTTADVLADVLDRRRSVEDVLASEAMDIQGHPDQVRTFFACFTSPRCEPLD